MLCSSLTDQHEAECRGCVGHGVSAMHHQEGIIRVPAQAQAKTHFGVVTPRCAVLVLCAAMCALQTAAGCCWDAVQRLLQLLCWVRWLSVTIWLCVAGKGPNGVPQGYCAPVPVQYLGNLHPLLGPHPAAVLVEDNLQGAAQQPLSTCCQPSLRPGGRHSDVCTAC